MPSRSAEGEGMRPAPSSRHVAQESALLRSAGRRNSPSKPGNMFGWACVKRKKPVGGKCMCQARDDPGGMRAEDRGAEATRFPFGLAGAGPTY